MTYQSLNPATGKLLKTFEEISDKQLEMKMAAAVKCFAVWRKKSFDERALIVNKVEALMLELKEALAQNMSIEMGKRIAEARGEVEFSSHIFELLRKKCRTFFNTNILASGYRRSPYGKQLDWRVVRG